MSKNSTNLVVGSAAAILALLAIVYLCSRSLQFLNPSTPLNAVETIIDMTADEGEPFGIAVGTSGVFVSDGLNGRIIRIRQNDYEVFATGLNTPSGIAFDPQGNLIVADTGSHTIKRIDTDGKVSIVAGAEGQSGDLDGESTVARFNAPIGIAIDQSDGTIFVADTYNDKIKKISSGQVSTVSGSARGFVDGVSGDSRFDTPCGIAVWKDGMLLVADTGNRSIRVINKDRSTWTLAGKSAGSHPDGLIATAGFAKPTAITLTQSGDILVADQDSVRVVASQAVPTVQTLVGKRSAHIDGPINRASFSRISGVAVDTNGSIFAADSNNAAVRRIYGDAASMANAAAATDKSRPNDPIAFRNKQIARWPYDPPDSKRDIAGTLGEIRGEIISGQDAWFHNGLDIAGSYGEKARFVADETVLDPISTSNYRTLRELIRLPRFGYVHINLGRDADNRPLGDSRFLLDANGSGVRVRRGSTFAAGEVIGTLNRMNHVHLIVGSVGHEMNALDALVLPGVSDSIAPTIQEVNFYDRNWNRIETKASPNRNRLSGQVRLVVRGFDRMDGNPERRKLGIFRAGYQLLKHDGSPLSEPVWNIRFDRNPVPSAIGLAYAKGSKSGATGETILDYIVTNRVDGNSFSEGFIDTAQLIAGSCTIRVLLSDYFGNVSQRDILIEVL